MIRLSDSPPPELRDEIAAMPSPADVVPALVELAGVVAVRERASLRPASDPPSGTRS